MNLFSLESVSSVLDELSSHTSEDSPLALLECFTYSIKKSDDGHAVISFGDDFMNKYPSSLT